MMATMNGNMALSNFGFSLWFAENKPEDGPPDCRVARVTAVNRDRYLVRTETTEMFAEATGKLLYGAASPTDLPCVGDWVTVQIFNQDTLAIIHAVFPRKSWLRRKAAGRKTEHQMIAANIDSHL
jgi:ribosome biogenesis GTPase